MNGRIVIHTEDAELYLLLKHILTLEGFSAENTNRLTELLSRVHLAPPLAVIVDCSDPDMNASAVCARIRANTKPEAKVVSLVIRRTAATVIAWPRQPWTASYTVRSIRSGCLHFCAVCAPMWRRNPARKHQRYCVTPTSK